MRVPKWLQGGWVPEAEIHPSVFTNDRVFRDYFGVSRAELEGRDDIYYQEPRDWPLLLKPVQFLGWLIRDVVMLGVRVIGIGLLTACWLSPLVILMLIVAPHHSLREYPTPFLEGVGVIFAVLFIVFWLLAVQHFWLQEGRRRRYRMTYLQVQDDDPFHNQI